MEVQEINKMEALMSVIIVTASSILITIGIYLVVNGLGALHDDINKFTVNMIIDVIVGVLLIILAIYTVVMLL